MDHGWKVLKLKCSEQYWAISKNKTKQQMSCTVHITGALQKRRQSNTVQSSKTMRCNAWKLLLQHHLDFSSFFPHFFWHYDLLLILITAGCGSGVTIGRPFLYAFIMAGITPWCDTTHEIQDICFLAVYTQPLVLSYSKLTWLQGLPSSVKYNTWAIYSFWHPGNLLIRTVRCIVSWL